MSFDLYFAGSHVKESDELLIRKGCCRLYSQLNDRSRIRDWIQNSKDKNTKLFVDSGAFTAWSKGKYIDVDEYINYLNAKTKELTLFASVDNIPGELTRTPTLQEKKESPILSWDNYMYMRERITEKDKLLPVFHIGEDFKHLNNILEVILDGKHIPYIALGGTVGLDKNVKDSWYKQCFKVIKQSSNPDVKVHAFGMTSLDILESYPFQSADSTSWIMATANGSIYTKFGTVCVSNVSSNKPNHILKLSTNIQNEIKAGVEKYGVTLEQCMEDYKARGIVNISYVQEWAENYEYKGNNRYQKRLF